ncbi:MAG: ABC transporter permease [Rikenellaceae bacterium]|jgi:lipoprotein-releasing system permease protein|nr:ABC transporter permease [Rikenellaceae bacterium]
MGKKTNAPFFIARRLIAESGGHRNSVMVKVATLSVGIGMAVMLLAIGVISGFKHEIAEKLTGFSAQVRIVHYDQSNPLETKPISADQPFLPLFPEVEGFSRMNRYAAAGGVVKGEEAIQGILLKGVGDDFDWSFFRTSLIDGQLPAVGDGVRNKDVLISKKLALQMGFEVGSKMEVVFVRESPRRDLFRVAGIYDTGLGEMDQVTALTDLRNVQRVNGWGADEITGYEIDGIRFADLAPFSARVFDAVNSVADRLDGQLMVINLREQNPVLFDWLDTHNLNGAIIITVMLLVAVFNMIAALLIILLEKTSMVGVLKALGMENRDLQKLFIYRSAYIIVKGLFWGNLVGLALCFLQRWTGFLKLNAEGYFLSMVPVHVPWGAVAALNLGAFAVIVALLTLPTLVIARVLPEKTIRFE